MKGIQGLSVAIVLGIAAAVFNWLYLNSKSGGEETIDFVGIADSAYVDSGHYLLESDLTQVSIPKSSVGNLTEFCVLYSARQSVVGFPVYRRLEGGSLLLRQDLTTPKQSLDFGGEEGNERAIGIPVDVRTFVPSLVEPGDKVSFLLPPTLSGSPTPADPMDMNDPGAVPAPSGPIQVVGPFEVLALGNRLGSADVLRAGKKQPIHENIMTVKVWVDAQGTPTLNDPNNPDKNPQTPQNLKEFLAQANFQPVGIMLHPRQTSH